MNQKIDYALLVMQEDEPVSPKPKKKEDFILLEEFQELILLERHIAKRSLSYGSYMSVSINPQNYF